MKWVSQNKNKIYQKLLVVKSIHNSKKSTEKVNNSQIKFSEFDCLTGYSVFLFVIWN